MLQKFNFHSHSNFCDGKNSLEEMVKKAIALGLTHYGFSSHAPVPFENKFAIPQNKVQDYLMECSRLKNIYADKIHLYSAMEFDYIPNIMENIDRQAQKYNLDYFIGSVHMVKEKGINNNIWFIDGSSQETYDKELESVFHCDVHKGVKTFFAQTNEMIVKTKPDILGHFDKIKMHNKERFFSENDKWYENLVYETLECVKKNNKTVIEINTRGLYKKRYYDYFPSQKWFKVMKDMEIPVTISTDCHKTEEIDLLFEETLNLLKTTGFKEVWYYEQGWKAKALN
ncbi:MAG: histidinol-phosphatase [Bacteroidales bacterium]|jgi:histidinol-phosphatase (PHP family)|nr:histidinol-phosphatase [Bacteroidales bacterium]